MTQSPDAKPETSRAVEAKAGAGGALAEYHEKECNRYVNGACMTTRCLRRGGYQLGTIPDYANATCEAHETAVILRNLASSPALPAAGEVREALYRDIFAEITAKAIPVCDPTSDDPERVRHYQLPVGPLHRAAGKLGFQMFNGEQHLVEAVKEIARLKAALALQQSKEAGEKRDLKEEMMDCYQFGIVDPASPVPQGEDIDPADVWDDYCEETPEDSRSLQGALAFGFHAALAAPAPTGVAPAASGGTVARCEICDWPLAEDRSKGCVPGDCSYRPDDPAEQERIRKRRAALTADAPAVALRDLLERAVPHIEVARMTYSAVGDASRHSTAFVLLRDIKAALAASDRE
jgi:hypothetical protein